MVRRLDVATASGADVVVTDWAEFAENADIERAKVSPRSADWALLAREGAEIACATGFWAPAALLLRRSVVEQIGGFRDDLTFIDDARFLFDAAHCGARFVHAPHLGTYYRVGPGRLSRCDPARFWLDVLHNGEQVEVLWGPAGRLMPHR